MFPGVRPYRCHHCEKSFTQRCSLESHCLKVHGVNHQYEYKQRRSKVRTCRVMAFNDSTSRHLMQQRANVDFLGVRLRGLWSHNEGARSTLLAPQNPAPVLPGPPQVLRQEAFQVQLLSELSRERDDVAGWTYCPARTRVLIGVFQKFCDISALPYTCSTYRFDIFYSMYHNNINKALACWLS